MVFMFAFLTIIALKFIVKILFRLFGSKNLENCYINEYFKFSFKQNLQKTYLLILFYFCNYKGFCKRYDKL